MQNTPKRAPNSVAERCEPSALEPVCARLRQWRDEFATERGAAQLTAPDARDLSDVFARWQQLEQDPRELLFVIAACAWMFRVGPANDSDIERELGKLVAAATKVLGRQDAGLAYLLGDALRPQLRRVMFGKRYWKAGQVWFAPGPHALEVHADVRARGEFGLRAPGPAVPSRNGRVPALDAIMAAVVVVHRLRVRGHRSKAVPTGQALATALRGRTVPAAYATVEAWTVAAYGDPAARLDSIDPNAAAPEGGRNLLTTVAGVSEASLPGLSARLEGAFRVSGWPSADFTWCRERVGLDPSDAAADPHGHVLDETFRTLLAEWGARIVPWAYSLKLGGIPTALRSPSRGKARRAHGRLLDTED